MTDKEIQLLAIGAAIGMYFMLLLQILFGLLDDRRDRKAARAAEAMLEAARARVERDNVSPAAVTETDTVASVSLTETKTAS